MAKIVQNNLGKTILYSNTFEYFVQIYSFAKIFVVFSWANLFGYSFVIFLSCRIYSDIHSSNIYGNEYIWIFIRTKIWYSSHTPKVSSFFRITSLSLREDRRLQGAGGRNRAPGRRSPGGREEGWQGARGRAIGAEENYWKYQYMVVCSPFSKTIVECRV